MPGFLRAVAALAATAILLAPAIWNRFPLLQYDTGGYLARWFEGTLVPSRSTVYGLFLVLGAQPDFWPAVVVQAGLTVWVLALLLRTHGFGGRPLMLFAVTALLGALTTLPWLASILLTDIFAGLAVLALHLLVFADDGLRRWERTALIVLIGFSAATHGATFAVALLLLLAAALARGLFKVGAAAGIARGAAALALGAAMLLAANFAVSGRLAWTPGGAALAFGRMLQDGVVARYLAEHCPNPRLRLCAHRDELPTDADAFFWGEGVFDRLGRFAGLGEEMASIVRESLREYPLLQARLAAVATLRQLVRVRTGEGVVNTIWHSYAIVEESTPAAVPAMRAARQQQGEFGFAAINRLQVPVALLSMLLLPVLAFGIRRQAFAGLGYLAATTALALLANAVICGVLANPHDRYGARLVWLAPLMVLLTVWRLLAARSHAGADRAAGPASGGGRAAAPVALGVDPAGR